MKAREIPNPALALVVQSIVHNKGLSLAGFGRLITPESANPSSRVWPYFWGVGFPRQATERLAKALGLTVASLETLRGATVEAALPVLKMLGVPPLADPHVFEQTLFEGQDAPEPKTTPRPSGVVSHLLEISKEQKEYKTPPRPVAPTGPTLRFSFGADGMAEVSFAARTDSDTAVKLLTFLREVGLLPTAAPPAASTPATRAASLSLPARAAE